MVEAMAMPQVASDRCEIVVEHADQEACARYRAFAGPLVKGAAQHPLWYETWLASSKERGQIVWVLMGEQPVAALPLVESKSRSLTSLRFAGEDHANGNFVPHLAGAALSLDPLLNAIRMSLPHIALISLERQLEVMAGQTNLLLPLASRRSPDIALAVDLAGGFAKVLEKANGKKKKRKRRMQVRRYEEAGGEVAEKGEAPDRIRTILNTYFQIKRVRFAEAGIADAFGAPHIQSFWRDLMVASQSEPDRPFTVEALVVGGQILAVTGSSHLRDRTICEFGGISQDELSSTSPGEYLAYTNIEEACAKGMALYDFSVGDEGYKRSWCDMESTQFDVVLPLTSAGRLATAASNAVTAVKQRVKSNPTLWKFAKALRRLR